MHDFRVELDAVQPAFDVAHRRVGRVGGRRQRGETLRRLLDAVAVRHPDVEQVGQVVQQRIGGGGADLRRAVLARLGRRDLAAERVGQRLHAVADAEHRLAHRQNVGRQLRRVRLVDAVRPAGQHVALRLVPVDVVDSGVEWEDLGVHPLLADAPGDELRVLRAEVENSDAAVAWVGHGSPLGTSNEV